MKRLFEEHYLRIKETLDGFWQFAKDAENIGSREHWEKNFPLVCEIMPVPGCWDTKTAHFDYDGIGWYKKTIHLKKAGNALFNFEGVSGIAEIFLDGKKLGKHNGSYTPFSFLKKSLSSGDHELIVKVDNFQHPGKVIPDYSDWHLYGGIFRSVSMEMLDKVWIKHLNVNYTIENNQVILNPEIVIKNITSKSINDKLKLHLNNKLVGEVDFSLKAGEEKRHSIKLGKFKIALWSPESPNLHLVKVEYAGDDLQERTGFRTVEMRKNGIMINGELSKIRGINRHHEYGDSGFTVPPEITLKDFEIIKEMGCNAVRNHYPIDRYAMDICDELGLLFWAEIPMWGRWPYVVAQKPYLKLAETMLEEMIENYINHPAIFTWSVLNECATDIPDGEYTVKRLTDKARAVDPYHPITYASNKIHSDLGYKHIDLIGINAYPGWYDADKDKLANWTAIIEKLNKKLKKERLSDTPVLVTETGAGAIYGDRSLEDRKWSENTQARILKDNISTLLAREDVAGVFVWQFCDIRCQTRDWERRPGTFNNKGVMDRFRRPKMGYYTIKELYGSLEKKKKRKI